MDAKTEQQAPLSLFDRLPAEIFRPLASENRERYWALLIRLQETFFGPDAVQFSEDGFLRRTITLEIERYLEDCVDWVADDGEPLDTPSSVRANLILTYLISSGWLREERIGVRRLIVMPPVIQKFLEDLQLFAEEGPKLVGGKVNLIYNSLVAIQKDPLEQASVLPEAAREARALISSLSGISVRVREVMEELRKRETTASFIAGFFRDYISNIYIHDYHDMRTQNHPLRHRHAIVQIALELRDDQKIREKLLSGYAKFHKKKSIEEIERLFERDVGRLLKFQEVEHFLDRLDESVHRATRQALAYISYKLRTPDQIERAIDNTIAVLVDEAYPEETVETPFAPGALFSEEMLRPPRLKKVEPKVSSFRMSVMTPEQRARSELRLEMKRAREVSRRALQVYVRSNVKSGQAVTSDHLPIRSIADLVAFRELARASFLTASLPPSQQRSIPLLRYLKGVRVRALDGVTENHYMAVPRFEVHRLEE